MEVEKPLADGIINASLGLANDNSVILFTLQILLRFCHLVISDLEGEIG